MKKRRVLASKCHAFKELSIVQFLSIESTVNKLGQVRKNFLQTKTFSTAYFIAYSHSTAYSHHNMQCNKLSYSVRAVRTKRDCYEHRARCYPAIIRLFKTRTQDAKCACSKARTVSQCNDHGISNLEFTPRLTFFHKLMYYQY